MWNASLIIKCLCQNRANNRPRLSIKERERLRDLELQSSGRPLHFDQHNSGGETLWVSMYFCRPRRLTLVTIISNNAEAHRHCCSQCTIFFQHSCYGTWVGQRTDNRYAELRPVNSVESRQVPRGLPAPPCMISMNENMYIVVRHQIPSKKSQLSINYIQVHIQDVERYKAIHATENSSQNESLI